MCDYSIHLTKTRDAVAGDQLVVTQFNTSTRGLATPKDCNTAVCLKEGSELAIAVTKVPRFPWLTEKYFLRDETMGTAKFVQVDKDNLVTHHDAVEFLDGRRMKLNNLPVGTKVSVLQVPAVKAGLLPPLWEQEKARIDEEIRQRMEAMARREDARVL